MMRISRRRAMWRYGSRARALRRRWWSWSTAGLNGMATAMSSFARGWTARMLGLRRWQSLLRLRIAGWAREGGSVVASCFGADVCSCGVAHGRRGVWQGRTGRRADGGGCDERECVCRDGRDADDVGFLSRDGAGGDDLSDAGCGCVVADGRAGEDGDVSVSAAGACSFCAGIFVDGCRFVAVFFCGAAGGGVADCGLRGIGDDSARQEVERRAVA